MAPDAQHVEQYVSSLDLSGRSVAVIGGTNGIGEAMVQRLIKQNVSKVYIMGRSEDKGKELVEQAQKAGKTQAFYLKCDLLTLKGMKAAAQALTQAAGPKGLDTVIETQGGTPKGRMNLTEDGNEKSYAVQSLSRFAITYHLVHSDALTNDAKVFIVANSGRSVDDLEIDDLNLKNRVDKVSRRTLFMNQSFRDSTILDSITLEFGKRYPQYQFLNMFPGLVRHDNFSWARIRNEDLPFPFDCAMYMGMRLLGLTPAAFAPMPIYLAFCDDKERANSLEDSQTWTEKLAAMPVGKWANDPENRRKLFDKLEGEVVAGQ